MNALKVEVNDNDWIMKTIEFRETEVAKLQIEFFNALDEEILKSETFLEESMNY